MHSGVERIWSTRNAAKPQPLGMLAAKMIPPNSQRNVYPQIRFFLSWAIDCFFIWDTFSRMYLYGGKSIR